jgi:hypothetical protein
LAPATEVPIQAEVVRPAVERIVASSLFSESPRLSCFLRYLVEETLAGRSDRIKEYNIGVDVYGRPPDYDPKIDAIVRVEAGRLRSKLAKYYAAEGGSDPVLIELPRGTYVPVLSQLGSPEPQPARIPLAPKARRRKVIVALGVGAVALLAISFFCRPATQTTRLSIAVLPLVNVTGDADTTRFTKALTEELTSRIAAENVFPVASRTESDEVTKSPRNLAELGRTLRQCAVGRERPARFRSTWSDCSFGDRSQRLSRLVAEL